MFESRFTSQSHENNGQDNGVLHEALPGTGTLPQELLREAAKAEGERAPNRPAAGAAQGQDATQSVEKPRSHGDRGNEGGDAASQTEASRAASAAGEAPRPDGRQKNGQFSQGNKGGPGNPFARKIAQIREGLRRVCSQEDMDDILVAMIQKAKGGDLPCAKFVYGYMIGRQPPPPPDPDLLDMHEWQIYRESSGWMNEVNDILSRPAGSMALNLVRVAQPAMDKQRWKDVAFTLGAQGKQAERVQEHLLDPVNGLEKVRKEMDRHQTAVSKQKKKRRR